MSPRETAFAAFLGSAITHWSPLLSWPPANQLTALAPPGLSQCKTAPGQYAQKISPIDLKQHKPADIWVMYLCSRYSVTWGLHGYWVVLFNWCHAPDSSPLSANEGWKQLVSLNCRQLSSMKSKQGMSRPTHGHMPWPAQNLQAISQTRCAPCSTEFKRTTLMNQVIKYRFKPLCWAYLPGLLHCASSYWWAHTANKFLPHPLAFWQSTTGHS